MWEGSCYSPSSTHQSMGGPEVTAPLQVIAGKGGSLLHTPPSLHTQEGGTLVLLPSIAFIGTIPGLRS